jgi:hypothetical protein
VVVWVCGGVFLPVSSISQEHYYGCHPPTHTHPGPTHQPSWFLGAPLVQKPQRCSPRPLAHLLAGEPERSAARHLARSSSPSAESDLSERNDKDLAVPVTSLAVKQPHKRCLELCYQGCGPYAKGRANSTTWALLLGQLWLGCPITPGPS